MNPAHVEAVKSIKNAVVNKAFYAFGLTSFTLLMPLRRMTFRNRLLYTKGDFNGNVIHIVLPFRPACISLRKQPQGRGDHFGRFDGIGLRIANPVFPEFEVHRFDPVKPVTLLVEPLVEALGIAAAVIQPGRMG